ncbi:MAG: sugar transporter, partial [Firmicutes bacterium]|nr:sugar transporter [Bacillota bacterium]
EEETTLKGMFKAIVENDQLLYTAIAMSLFMIGYVTTTSFGLYFFKYAYGDENMYSIFAVILGLSQIGALIVFPLFSRAFSRRTLYTAATVLVVAGYVVFFFSPMNMIYIGLAGILIFLGQAFIQLLMLMFLADTVEYGQWKLGKRNESVTFSLQPFINKMGGAVASGIVGVTVIISGINDAQSAADVTPEGLLIMKSAMLILPLIFILASYLIYRYKYKIDSQTYQQILLDLQKRGDINLE